MACNDSLGELLMQAFQKFAHGFLLRLCAGITGISRSVQAAFVADSDAVLVTVQAVSPHHFQRPTVLDASVTAHNVVIAATVLPSALMVPAVNLAKAALLPRMHC